MATNYNGELPEDTAGFLYKFAIVDGVLTLDGREIKGLRGFEVKADGACGIAELTLKIDVN
ncbi:MULTISPECIES: hypothetical protein [Paenibacillus]|uniref:hypothetical protein n=1 Tax=Paenibacillus TaxID=44249 RepID=UPI00096D6514|nr:hypothetical protein [Paenibacillus odorifer]OMC93784.1 hypothetical protein BJP46_30900 [Paenibacillus odorifer]OMD08136.1 hypothetical protein BJP50_31100 [Paenibacillus odorifer]